MKCPKRYGQWIFVLLRNCPQQGAPVGMLLLGDWHYGQDLIDCGGLEDERSG